MPALGGVRAQRWRTWASCPVVIRAAIVAFNDGDPRALNADVDDGESERVGP